MLCQDTAKDRVDTIPMNAKSNGDSGCWIMYADGARNCGHFVNRNVRRIALCWVRWMPAVYWTKMSGVRTEKLVSNCEVWDMNDDRGETCRGISFSTSDRKKHTERRNNEWWTRTRKRVKMKWKGRTLACGWFCAEEFYKTGEFLLRNSTKLVDFCRGILHNWWISAEKFYKTIIIKAVIEQVMSSWERITTCTMKC